MPAFAIKIENPITPAEKLIGVIIVAEKIINGIIETVPLESTGYDTDILVFDNENNPVFSQEWQTGEFNTKAINPFLIDIRVKNIIQEFWTTIPAGGAADIGIYQPTEQLTFQYQQIMGTINWNLLALGDLTKIGSDAHFESEYGNLPINFDGSPAVPNDWKANQNQTIIVSFLGTNTSVSSIYIRAIRGSNILGVSPAIPAGQIFNFASEGGANKDLGFEIITGTPPNAATTPAISVQPTGYSIFEGQQLILDLTASDYTSIQWYKNNTVIDGAINNDYGKVSILSDSGNYKAKLTNDLGGIPAELWSNEVTITINAIAGICPIPELQNIPTTPRTVQVGQSFNVSVNPLSATTGFEWYKGSTKIIGNVSASTSILTIVNAQLNDSAQYSCIVTNACGAGNTTSNITSPAYQIIVETPGETPTMNDYDLILSNSCNANMLMAMSKTIATAASVPINNWLAPTDFAIISSVKQFRWLINLEIGVNYYLHYKLADGTGTATTIQKIAP